MLSEQKSNKYFDWIKKYSSELVNFSLIIFFILEIFNKIYFFIYPTLELSISFYPKIIIQLIFILPVLINFNHLKRTEKFFVLFSFSLATIGIIRFNSNLELLIIGMKHLNKLTLFIYVFLFFNLIKPSLKLSLEIFDWILIINSILIIIGFTVGIEYLKSYPFTSRFGYSGAFCRHSVNDASLFYLIANFYSFLRWQRGAKSYWFFLVVFFTSFLIGTKAIYLQNIILIIYGLTLKNQIKKVVSIIAIISVITLVFFYNFSFWTQYLDHKGILYVLTSARSELFMTKLPIALENTTIASLLFGFNNPFQYFIEMDMIDLVLTIGLTGSIMLLYFYFTLLFSFERKNIYAWIFTCTFFLLVIISGRYLYSGLNAIYLPFFIYYLKQNMENSKHN